MREGETERRGEGGVVRTRKVAKLSDAEGEAAETQTWIEFAESCEYLPNDEASKLLAEYDAIIGKLVNMIQHPDHWKL